MSDESLNEMQQLFLQEMGELLEMIEADTLELESNPNQASRVDSLFRSFHTLKGGAGMSGFSELCEYTHTVENLLDQARSGVVSVSSVLVSTLLDSLDCLKGFMGEALGTDELDRERVQNSLKHLGEFSKLEHVQSLQKPQEEVKEGPEQTYMIHLCFRKDLFASRADPMVILMDLDALGDMQVFAHSHSVPPLDQLQPSQLYLRWTVLLKASVDQDVIEGILMFFLDGHNVSIQRIKGAPKEIINQEFIDSNVSVSKKVGDEVIPEEPVKVSPLSKQSTSPSLPSTTPIKSTKPVASSLRVDIHKLDKLINMVGELLIIHTRLKQSHDEIEEKSEEIGERLQYALDDHDRIIQELHSQAMKVRMVPMANIMLPLKRLVRDFSAQSGKQIQLLILGEETEIDKTIIEKLSGPLKHLIRNAIDHGIESPEKRKLQGKDPKGTVTLSAANRRSSIVVEVSDDGGGIDCDRVLQIARDKQLLDRSETPSQEEIIQLLFHSGFSTAQQVTEISGRGVGMDVVRQEIEMLHGSIVVESKVGKGTRFRVKLPLTLAIIEGLLVGVGERVFVIPLLSVVETLHPRSYQIKSLKAKGEMVEIRGHYFPLLRMHDIFSLQPTRTPDESVVILVEESGRKSCLLVDEIIDQQQVVIKSIEENLLPVEGISGATILGDGRVSLILDISGLIRRGLTHL